MFEISLNFFALAGKLFLRPKSVFEGPELHHDCLQRSPLFRGDADHQGKATVVIMKPAIGCSPGKHEEPEVYPVLFIRQMLRVRGIGVGPEGKNWK